MQFSDKKIRQTIYGFYLALTIALLIGAVTSSRKHQVNLLFIFIFVSAVGFLIARKFISLDDFRDDLPPILNKRKRLERKIIRLTEKRESLLFTIEEKSKKLEKIQNLVSSKFEKKKEHIIQSVIEFDNLMNQDDYFSKYDYQKWLEKWGNLEEIARLFFSLRDIEISFKSHMSRLFDAFSYGFTLRENKNEEYIQKEILEYQDFFNSVEKYGFTQKQLEAIIINEYRNLVVAGAGTGKTSTIIGKTGYLLRKGKVASDEILLLSFGRDPKKEMTKRIQDRFRLSLDVNTFHGQGMKIIAEAHEKKPNISELSTDQIKLQNFIGKILNDKLQDTNFVRNLNKFFLNQIEYKSLWEFKTLDEYHSHLRKNNIRSLKGDLVKSYEELEIANYLYINGVNYEYEPKYEYETTSKLYGQYTPDFFIPDYDIYIEHFGIDRNNNTASCVPKERYLKEMEWKRKTHNAYATKLIETYSYERMENKLLENLESKLKSEKVSFNPIQDQQIFNQLNALGYVQPITGLIATFINLFKSSNKDIQNLKYAAEEAVNSERCKAFIEIFEPIIQEYEVYLTTNNEIDFNDMINKATEYIQAGKVKTNYQYILVDEFQDISQSRSRLLKALLDQNPKCKLFCVGDDWQSIYRFAGSDLNIMTNFEKYYGTTEIMFLDETFRFNNQICDFSTKFILKNPKQIIKQLKTHEKVEDPSVTVIHTEDSLYELRSILNNLDETGGTVFILGRYRNQKPNIELKYPNLTIKFLTGHSSKGTQADYVIIIGLKSGKMGFPCEITDDPILNLVLSKEDTYPHSEERRLFYVAVTRAKKHVYLIADQLRPSVFIKEITSEDYAVNHDENETEYYGNCPRCDGSIRFLKGNYGDFYSCCNYPYCSYRPPRCPKCKTGYLRNHGNQYECNKCNHKTTPCPECEEGIQVLRDGMYGSFFGCSNYPECTYTRNIRY
ncbi:MAG: UvrD-helicase domain-containing protein [Candidatus Bathyarchaeota archaeon]|nr:UvrD-helicase domain-containing protein [Candidatus Bathyarchaeota archaeon]